MHAAYTKDPITNKLASFKLPPDMDVQSEGGRADIRTAIHEDFRPGDKVPVLIMIDTKSLPKEEIINDEPENA